MKKIMLLCILAGSLFAESWTLLIFSTHTVNGKAENQNITTLMGFTTMTTCEKRAKEVIIAFKDSKVSYECISIN